VNAKSELTSPTLAILTLIVKNHPGVMSHVCGLISRRAFNMESIICLPMKDKRFSQIWLLLNEQQRLPQLQAQLLKLQDVLQVQNQGIGREQLDNIETLFSR